MRTFWKFTVIVACKYTVYIYNMKIFHPKRKGKCEWKKFQPPRRPLEINLAWLWRTTETTWAARKRLVWRSNSSWSSACGSSRDWMIVVIIGRSDQCWIDHCRLTIRPPLLSGQGVKLSIINSISIFIITFISPLSSLIIPFACKNTTLFEGNPSLYVFVDPT